MTLLRVRVLDGRPTPHEVLVQARTESSTAELVQALDERGFPKAPFRVDGYDVPPSAGTIGDLGLVHGTTIELGTTGFTPTDRAPGRYLVAVSGPEAGSWWRVPEGGRLLIGRGSDADVPIRDALVSGRHATLTFATDGGMSIEDLGSSNGTIVEGQRVSGDVPISLGSYLQVGSTVLTVLEIGPTDLPVDAPPKEGARPFQRHFREALEPLSEKLHAPAPPEKRSSESSRMWWQYLLPLVTGAGFAVMTGRWIFLLLVAVSPIAMVVQHLRRRRKDAKEEAAAEKLHEAALVEHAAELARVRSDERERRRRAAVVGGEAVLLAELRHRRLWERIPGDEDHLEVCLGLADQPSVVETMREGPRESLWAVPLSVSLPETGSLLVSGQLPRARAVGRSMLLNLAATHSPLELNISVLTTEEQETDWNWVRWLPHAFVDGGGARVYSTRDQRDAALTSITQQIEAREEGGAGAAHVVVIDGANNVDGSRLTAILTRGAEHGVHGIVLDQFTTPEGVRGTLTLGEQPDEGVFVARHVARVDGILTAEVAVEWSERAALAMAGLRPPADDSHATAPEIHLTDLLPGEVDADWVRQRWKASSPQEHVVVGLAGRTPIEIDIVRHGPHAIVGGATRSGKTEFLLTWLTAMCLSNSPDDLAIMVADFKGGVDHVQTARLPHVISLVTNQDIRAFERTLVLMEAEIERRQDVFSSAGTSNIEAYRAARERDDKLAPVPRLLVVVDEFSELRQADRDEGGGYMSRLESVARVGAGLGVHLVLVTQNFAGGQLSDQIEGQVGLGVCFRVEQGEHSKVVLRSAVAATIPADRPGRAWARLRGHDLIEFQCARVAGRRRDLIAVDKVLVEFVPFTTLPQVALAPASGSVPHDETDLALLIERVQEAAQGRPIPVPWPSELSPDLHLSEVLVKSDSTGTVIGLSDVPERQRQVPTVLLDSDEQILLTGSSSAEAGRMLVTIGVSEALRRSPADFHLYGIDLEGNSLQPLEHLPHVGAVACLNDDLAVRIVRRLQGEASQRRSLFEQHGVSELVEYERLTGTRLPRVRLLVNGADRLLGSSESDVSPLLRPVAALSADAPGTGVGMVLSGGISLVGKRMTQRANRRFVLRFADPGSYPVAGVPRDKIVEVEQPGRAWDATAGHLVQWASFTSGDSMLSEVVEGLGEALREHYGDAGDGWPVALPEVRWPLLWSRLDPESLRIPEGYGPAIPVGVDTDTAHWTWVDAEEDGPWVAIGGPARSGRSTALIAMASLARDLGWEIQALAPTRRSPLRLLQDDGARVVGELSGLTVATRRTLYLIDDLHRLPGDAEGPDKLLEDAAAPMLLVIAGPDDLLGRRTGVLRGLPEPRITLTLAPVGSTATGNVRIPDHLRGDPRPGRGVVWNAGEFTGVQIPQPDLQVGAI